MIGFDQNDAQTAIALACSAAGIFSPEGRVFGRGAHRRDGDDALTLHLGGEVLTIIAETVQGRRRTAITARPAGKHEGKIYYAAEALPPPADTAATPDEAQALLDLFGKWYFADGWIAQLLLLGWVGHAMLCGAFGWRAHVWLTGETAAGKSTLQKLIRAVIDRWCLVSEDASEAYIRQKLGEDKLPVMIDEAEPDDRAEMQRAMVNLARKGSSGASMGRGSSDHQAKEFVVHSSFLFSSILHAPLDPQDRNRFAILAMRQIPESATEPDLQLRYWRAAGRRLHRRMIEQWPRWDKTLGEYKEGIRLAGFQGRWRDTFGTLLACADLLLHDEAPSVTPIHSDGFGRLAKWVQQCVPMMDRGALEAEDTTTRCLRVLTSTLLPGKGGHHQETVGAWIKRAMEFEGDSCEFNREARAKLQSHGMRVVNLRKTPKGKWGAIEATLCEQVYVLVSSRNNVALRELFRGTKWYDGGWTQALAHARWSPDGGEPVPAMKGVESRLSGGSKDYFVAVPIEAMIGPVGNAATG